MLYLFCLFLSLSLIGINFKNINSIDDNALSRERTTMINGFFVVMVFFSHFNSYVNLSGNINDIYLKIFNFVGQLMVAPFLFYSGYGIYESIKTKKNYIKNFFKNRILKLFISFSSAICLYIILNLVIKQVYPVKTILLSFIGWESIGNSNWFMFATFCMYFIVLISFTIFKNDNKKALLLSLIGSVLYIMLVRRFKGFSWWFDTILCFNLGMLISYYKYYIVEFLKDKLNYTLSLILILIILLMCKVHGYSFIMYEIYSMMFVLLLLLVTFKVKIGNKALLWLGKNVFNIYILQRIGCIIYSNINFIRNNIYLYFALQIFTTIFLVIVFDYILKIIYRALKYSD